MRRYYTCACNFYFGKYSRFLIQKKETLPLHGQKNISFSHVKIFSRNTEKIINIKNINSLSYNIKTQVKKDLLNIKKKNIELVIPQYYDTCSRLIFLNNKKVGQALLQRIWDSLSRRAK